MVNMFEGQSEKFIKRHVQGRLESLRNMGKLMFHRLNAGAIRMGRNMIRLDVAGTADYLVLVPWNGQDSCQPDSLGMVAYIELKTDKGRQNDAQERFQAQVECMGFEYYIVRNTDELDKVLARFGVNV